MTPAVKLALAYCYGTGRLPTHLHIGTWSRAFSLIEESSVTSARGYRLKPEALIAIASHPLKLACDWFAERGFKAVPVGGGKRTSHYVEWRKEGRGDGVEAFQGLAYRKGGGSLTAEHGAAHGVPYRTSWQLAELGDAWPALLRPGMYAGERPSGEHPRDYLKRAVAAYQGAGQ